MNKLKEKYYIALGNLQNMATDNTKGSKGVDICVLDINEYVAYLQSKIDKINKILNADCIVEDIYYALCMLFEFEHYDDETMINKKLLDILKEVNNNE